MKGDKSMQRLRDFISGINEMLFGPSDWQVEESGASKMFTGSFLIYDRLGKIKLRSKGLIVVWPGLPAQVFIYDPPAFMKQHRHGSCLQLLRPNDNWFKLHFERPGRDFTEAYTYVEHFLTEAYVLTH
jgi:hypothetical protein